MKERNLFTSSFPNICNEILCIIQSKSIRVASISSNNIFKLQKDFIYGHSSDVIPLIETMLYFSHAW